MTEEQIEAAAREWAVLVQMEDQSSREAANSILEELTPLFVEQARIRHWNEMRPGKEPRLI